MPMTPHDELADELFNRLYDPGKYVQRGNHNTRKDRPEPLDMWKLRAIMTYFEDIQKRQTPDGKMVILARGPFRDQNPDLDGD